MKTPIFLLFAITSALANNSPLEELTIANNLFGRDVYQQIAQKKDGNFLVSPFSAETVLALTQSGCRGDTAQELRNALHLPDNNHRVESAMKTLLPKLKGTLHTANKMYVQNKYPIKSGFQKIAKQIYRADSENIDFTETVKAANSINNWVEEQTNKKIKNLISSDALDEDTKAILINALYFKANWSIPFQLGLTDEKDFHVTPTKKIQVKTLHHPEERFKYYECPHLNAQFLELPFEGGKASMVVVLPREIEGLSLLEENLDHVFSPRLREEWVNVSLPKFKIETSIDFKSILQNLGVRKVFEREADLSGISGKQGDLVIQKVDQKTFIDVNEYGVEAAAATSVHFVTVSLPPPPKNFVANHPFIFYIKVGDLVIFAGRVTDPSGF